MTKVMSLLVACENLDSLTTKLTVTQEIADYAEKMRQAGHPAMAQKLAARAKSRASHYMEDDKEIRDMMERMKGSGEDAPQSIQAHCLEMMMDNQKERYHHLLAKLEG